MTSQVELLIEELLLPELPWGGRAAVAAAVERELARIVAERGLPPGLAGREALSLSPPALHVPAGLRAEALGARVAEAIYTSMAGAAPAGPQGAGGGLGRAGGEA